MGPKVVIRRLDGMIPLFLAVYAEGDEDLDIEGRLARIALDRVQTYFGDAPLAHYTVHLELLRPLPDHTYDFSQEHDESGTFSLGIDRAVTTATPADVLDTKLFNYAHHMAHSWVPKRAYGVGYSPFTWELPPIIDTIWFNEGFGRYAAIAAVAAGLPPDEGRAYRAQKLDALRAIIDSAPPFIKRLPLDVLSREASFMYSADFRTGSNTFARGSLMAAEMDDRIITRTRGSRSLRDALRALVAETARTGRPFDEARFPELIEHATGVAVRDIYERWAQALERS